MKKLLSPAVVIAAASLLFAGCAAHKPKSSSDSQKPPSKISKFMSSMTWKYQVTQNKAAKLGQKGQDMCIETLKSRAQLTAPAKWQIVTSVDQPLDWYFVAAAPDASLAFGWKVVRFPGNPPLEERYKNYLDGIHHAYDPNVQMLPQQKFNTSRGAIPSYLYYSQYWGQRLVIIIPQGDITTVLEFSGPAAATYQTSHALIQRILNSYSYRKL